MLDPETAPIVRKIYQLALDGLGCGSIAKRLMEERVPLTRPRGNGVHDVNYYA